MLIIPKAKMPSGCEKCPCWYDGTCFAADYWDHDYHLGKYAYSQTSRPEWCKLQEWNEERTWFLIGMLIFEVIVFAVVLYLIYGGEI